MAEVIGIFASALKIKALTSQVTHSITKLRSYYDQIQDSPKEIRDLFEELEGSLYFIEDYKKTLASEYPTTVLRSLERCETCVDQLMQLTDSLSLDIQANGTGRMKWSSVEAGLKKDKEERHMFRLERAVRLLCLSCQMHTR